MIWGLIPWEIPIRIGQDEARRRAIEELAKAKYGGTPDWLTNAAARVGPLIQRIVDFFTDLTRIRQSEGGGVNWGFVLAVVILLIAIGVVLWRVGLPRWRKRLTEQSLDLDPTAAPSDYRAAAAESAARGDWKAAVRDRFRAIVRELETATVLDVRPARTASEAAYLASRSLPAHAQALQLGAESFNGVLYGEATADQGTYQQMAALDDSVTSALSSADLISAAADSSATPAGDGRPG